MRTMSLFIKQQIIKVPLLWGALNVVLLFSHVVSASPVVGLGQWWGEVELAYELNRQDTLVKEQPPRNFNSDQYRERIKIQDQGYYIYDPALMSGNMGVTLEFLQERDSFVKTNRSQNGQLIGYNFDIGILPQKPYTLRAFANRNQDALRRDFGARSDITSSNIGARFDLREGSILSKKGFPYFRTSLGLTHSKTREDTRSQLGQAFRRNENRDVIDYIAHKGYETADLDFNYNYENVTDTALAHGGFRNHTANLGYSLDFGPTLNRRWDSHIGYLKRTGVSNTQFIRINEALRIDHYRNLSTNYHYSLNSFETRNGSTLSQIAAAQLRHQLYKNLTTTVRARGTTSDLPNGSRYSYLGGINLNYKRTLPGKGRLILHGGTSYQINDNNLDSSIIDIVDEPHPAPAVIGASGGFELNHPFVVLSTIEVVDTRGGARFSTQQGIDYDILQQGDNVEIIPIATSLIIQSGDPLEVTYSYEVAPSIRYSTLLWSLGGGVNFHWISFSVSHYDHNQTQLSGHAGQFLNDRRSDTVRLGFRGDWHRLQATADNSFYYENSTRLKYTRWQFYQFLAYTGLLDLTLSATTDESFTNFDLPMAREQKKYSARLALDGFVRRGWQVRAYTGLRMLRDSDIPNETVRDAGITVLGRMGKLTLQGTGNWNEYDRGRVTTRDWRLEIRVARRF